MTVDLRDPQHIGGIISVCIFGFLFSVSTWRLLGPAIGRNDTQHRFFVHKAIFHAFFSLYTLLETLYAVTMITHDGTSKWGYTLHVIALLVNLGLFLMLINVWGVLLQSEATTRNAALLLASINLAAVIWVCVEMHGTNDYDDFLTSHAYLTMVCANAFAKFSLCLLIIVYGRQLQNQLQSSPKERETMTKGERSIKVLMLRRISIVMLVS